MSTFAQAFIIILLSIITICIMKILMVVAETGYIIARIIKLALKAVEDYGGVIHGSERSKVNS